MTDRDQHPPREDEIRRAASSHAALQAEGGA